MFRRCIPVAVAALVAFSTTPAAAAVRYVFTAHSSFDGVTGTFSYTAPSFITTNRFVPATDFDSCTIVTPAGGTCTFSTPFIVDPTGGAGIDPWDQIGFQVNFLQPAYYFANGAFSTIGTHETTQFGAAQAATLVVSQVGGVPEPSSWALMIGGFGIVGAAARRRRRTAEPA